MKLLMKDPDCRYQNVTELIDDLELCRYLYENHSADTTPSSRILHPLFTDRIYGRDEEMLKCMRIFESAKNGRFRIILTGGPPGSGKTCFVTKFMTGASRYGGLQGCSKDNRHGSNIPYSGIAAAFGHVIRQILTRSDSEISAWRERFIEALGANLSLITEIIPGLEIITGPQTGQPGSGDIETLNRFLISFRKFAQTLARHAGPLVIFLDDIQWSDRAGLALVKSLACDHDLKHILLICAYRDNEIVPGDTLSDFLGEMKCNPEQVEFIKIGGLPDRDAVEMIEDIIQIPGGGCPELCGYIYRKTAGNPYYIREYIKTVFTGGLLKIFSGGRAEYDIAGMDMLPASESLASVLNSAMLNLPREMKNILAAGACAGWAFSPHLVAAILRVPVASVNACLDYLAEQGYIVRTDDGCRFVHDRVRETAYELIPESERLAIHRRSGRILFGMAGNDTETFYAVEQINLARDIITDGKELTDLSLLNFEAGLISQKIAAFAPALAYFRRAAELLPDDSWNCCYELTAGILKELTRCESVNGNTARAERIVLESLEHLNSPEEKAEFIILLIHQMNIKGRFSEAVELCLHALGLMGVEVPLNGIEKETSAEMDCLNDYLAFNGINALTGLKKNNDSRHILIIKILLQLGWPAYFFDKARMVFVSLKMMNLTIQYGLSRETIAVCCSYIGVTASVFGDYETAFSLWKTTAVIMENLNDRYYEAEICLKAANYVVPMIMHLRESEPVNLAGYNAGYLSGEHLCSGYIIAHKTVNSFHYGKELGHILSEIDDDIEFNLRTQNFLASEVMLSLKKVIICLAGDVKGLSANI
jgi:predicted ATPase